MRKHNHDWTAIIREQTNSGQTVRAYCLSKGIHPTTFYRHRRTCQQQDLVEIKASTRVENTPILLKTQRYSLAIQSGFDPRTLKLVLEVIGAVE